ncbi:hypothetical protein [Aureimonas ureilytica]|uniref:hypothetical protein n=1 Tax=Aureimonas ureilytica TaxID=401562 RepID=UPI0007349B0E|nr:hypothetical protein [Aureimonas ureilytica]
MPQDDGVRSVSVDDVLDRQFTADRLNQMGNAEVTCIRIAKGRLDTTAIIDLLSRQVVGGS